MARGDFENTRAVVMGLGRFGGGIGAARFLAERGADVLVTDTASAARLADARQELADLAVRERLGGHAHEDFAEADLVVVSPAVAPRGNPFLETARKAGAHLTSEIRMLMERLPDRGRVIGITGTAGKSTTSAMTAHALCGLGWRAHLGGNIGGSLLPHLERIRREDPVVLELSSFMLEDHLGPAGLAPATAVFTSFAPNHLDRHGTVEAYWRAKLQIAAPQQRGAPLIAPPKLIRALAKENLPSTLREVAGSGAVGARPLCVPGPHNRRNAALAAEAAACAVGAAPEDAAAPLASFEGLPHRLQPLGGGAYDDSKATTPEAAQRALRAFPEHGVHAILGGADKGSDLRPLARAAARRCRAVYTIGSTGPAIAEAVEAAKGNAHCCETLEQAVTDARQRMAEGDVLLLSPGCASWDRFDNYEERGERFKELWKPRT